MSGFVDFSWRSSRLRGESLYPGAIRSCLISLIPSRERRPPNRGGVRKCDGSKNEFVAQGIESIHFLTAKDAKGRDNE